MCTVTFAPRNNGYALAMNRDEKRARAIGLPPRALSINGRTVICPIEPVGGTWIALNDTGATLALINWYAVSEHVTGKAVSRGEVINTVSLAHTPGLVVESLARLPLGKINAFRLIGIFPKNEEIVEWRWNLKKLVRKNHRWDARQWISSGFDEPRAQRVRSRTFRVAQSQKSANSLVWLRRLHRSHSPSSGPFSTCMHRDDAATVSYTEVVVSARTALMRYHAGALCEYDATSVLHLQRRRA